VREKTRAGDELTGRKHHLRHNGRVITAAVRDARGGGSLVAVRARTGRAGAYIGVIGASSVVERPDGAAAMLRQLGADVRSVALGDDPSRLVDEEDAALAIHARALVFEPDERLDLAVRALRATRQVPELAAIGSLLVVAGGDAARIEPSAGFDDFLVRPYGMDELYARVRLIEWKRSEFLTEERTKVGDVVVDRARREVALAGRPIALTAREFALLAHLCERRGVVLSRDHLLANVWGAQYQGSPRTVDIHVRRLRAKLGDAFPLETLRGWGYRVAVPDGA
jgi:DNA-binding response OmpR family regulator